MSWLPPLPVVLRRRRRCWCPIAAVPRSAARERGSAASLRQGSSLAASGGYVRPRRPTSTRAVSTSRPSSAPGIDCAIPATTGASRSATAGSRSLSQASCLASWAVAARWSARSDHGPTTRRSSGQSDSVRSPRTGWKNGPPVQGRCRPAVRCSSPTPAAHRGEAPPAPAARRAHRTWLRRSLLRPWHGRARRSRRARWRLPGDRCGKTKGLFFTGTTVGRAVKASTWPSGDLPALVPASRLFQLTRQADSLGSVSGRHGMCHPASEVIASSSCSCVMDPSIHSIIHALPCSSCHLYEWCPSGDVTSVGQPALTEQPRAPGPGSAERLTSRSSRGLGARFGHGSGQWLHGIEVEDLTCRKSEPRRQAAPSAHRGHPDACGGEACRGAGEHAVA